MSLSELLLSPSMEVNSFYVPQILVGSGKCIQRHKEPRLGVKSPF